MKRFLLGRMFTPGTRFFIAVAVVGLTGALVTGLSTCWPAAYPIWAFPPDLAQPIACNGSQGLMDAILGPVTFGWKGGIGNHFVYGLFVGMAAVGVGMAGVLAAYRDADAKSLAEVARTETAPVLQAPRHPSYWPIIGALAVGTIAVGWVLNPALFMAGIFALVVVVGEWMLRAWAENATGDPNVNEEYRRRVASALEIPGIAVIAIGALAISLSRVLLAVSSMGAVAVAGAAAFVFLVGFTVVAYFPKVNRSVVSIFIVLAGLLVIGTGIFSAAIGERDFEEHQLEEEGDSPAEADVEGGSRQGQEDDGQLDDEAPVDDPALTTPTTEAGD
jgi:hypothetical protein